MYEAMNDNDRKVLHDKARLAAIAERGLFSEAARERLRRFPEAAAKRLGLPLGLITAVLHDTQYFVASFGLPEDWMGGANGTPVEWSFCRFAVEDRRDFVVNDVASEPLVAANPLARSGAIGCYAGTPLITADGHALGTLCVAGPEPRRFTEAELSDLRSMAIEAMREIEAAVSES